MGHTVTAAGRRWGVPARIVAMQLAATVLVAAAALWWRPGAAFSALLGGAVAVVPNICFAFCLGRGEAAVDGVGAARAGAVLLGQWLAKFLLTGALVLAAIAMVDLVAAAFVVGLAGALLAPLATLRHGHASTLGLGGGKAVRMREPGRNGG